jgi:hypothetical protein
LCINSIIQQTSEATFYGPVAAYISRATFLLITATFSSIPPISRATFLLILTYSSPTAAYSLAQLIATYSSPTATYSTTPTNSSFHAKQSHTAHLPPVAAIASFVRVIHVLFELFIFVSLCCYCPVFIGLLLIKQNADKA